MEDETTEVVEPESTEEETTEEVAEEEEQEETLEEVKARLAKAEEKAENQRIRAEKAEKKAKSIAPQSNYSTADIIALSKVDVDDIERVEKFMKDEGITAREALANDELQAILAIRAEKRNTAQATNVTNVRRGSTKVSDETLIANAQAGKLPEDDAGIERLIAAKLSKK